MWIEYGDLLCESLYSVRTLENADQKILESSHFLRNVIPENVLVIGCDESRMDSLMGARPKFIIYMMFMQYIGRKMNVLCKFTFDYVSSGHIVKIEKINMC